MNCPNCASTHNRKNGRYCGKHNYICVKCEHQFVELYSKRG
ncbi:IS1/IS1595 family N-terminal zinc-binding domain-containing protein [Brasilonema sennae]